MELIANRDLELVALKAILNSNEVISLFSEDMFSTGPNLIIFRTIKDAIASGTSLDRALLLAKLSEADQLNLIGGEFIIDKILDLDYDQNFVEQYAQELKELSIKRKVQLGLLGLADKSRKLQISSITSELSKIQQHVFESYGILDNETFPVLLDEEEKNLFSDTKPDNFIKTKFSEQDILLGGFELGELIVIAARPSMGKTSLALRYALNIASQDIGVEVISYEMSTSALVRRFLSMSSKIPGQRLAQGLLSQEEKEALRLKINELKTYPILVSAYKYSDLQDLVNHIRLTVQAKGVKVFIVDYVQQMRMNVGMETQELGKIARTLKNLAVELNIVILLLSQLNRAVESRKDKRPVMPDLRQSGNLEESPDKIFFLYREYYYSKQEADRGLAELILAKNRNGPLAQFNLLFLEEFADFREV